MPRVSSYTDPEELTDEEILKKYCKEPMTTEEFARCASLVAADVRKDEEFKNYPNHLEGILSRTIKNRLKKICEESKGKLHIGDFKTDDGYRLHPKFHDILMIILDTDFFDDRKTKAPFFQYEINLQIGKNAILYAKPPLLSKLGLEYFFAEPNFRLYNDILNCFARMTNKFSTYCPTMQLDQLERLRSSLLYYEQGLPPVSEEEKHTPSLLTDLIDKLAERICKQDSSADCSQPTASPAPSEASAPTHPSSAQ